MSSIAITVLCRDSQPFYDFILSFVYMPFIYTIRAHISTQMREIIRKSYTKCKCCLYLRIKKD